MREGSEKPDSSLSLLCALLQEAEGTLCPHPTSAGSATSDSGASKDGGGWERDRASWHQGLYITGAQ